MTLLDLLKKAAFAGDDLVQFLNVIAQRYPDVAPKAQELVAALSAAVAAENLVALATALPGEIANIAQGKLDPRDHPSDAI